MTHESFFGLAWPGKQAAAAQATASATWRIIPRRAGGSRTLPEVLHNSLTAGDNLEFLTLLREPWRESVDVIYIDPPYNTGRDFIYKDNYRSRREHNSSDHGRWHAQWLSMMFPRLIVAREFLKPSGFICISIGEDEVANLRKVADEVFGEECFAGQLIWKKAGTGKNDSRYAVVEHEYVLVYAKSVDNPGFNLDRGGVKTTRYNHSDSKGRYSLVRLDSKTLGYLSSLDFPITGPDGKTYWPDQPAGKDKVARWRWGREKVQEHGAELVFRRGFVYTKNYESAGAKPRSILDGARFGVTRTGRKDAEAALGIVGIFEFPKPVGLVKHLIDICGPSDAVVMDFFAGSGTTAQAVVELNAEDGGQRTFHMVQIPQPTDTKSVAYAEGFTTVFDICLARTQSVCANHGVNLDVFDTEPITD
ncbi:DNA methyltransferase [Corynebacterium phocae]|uniref:DNA methyltransferase n=1 Tax=Corynebacterium phocae TaxID=161895 RepID=A0A1L7D361_9CORY|nr:site-specific DNA-methyltransferase [Corynebacterium phocae]APT92564.1 DNA methyltransferase [Corynebacterium phocae]KAA8725164.1 site-specific DNA-methyltransferase [Corynebacterium phocae]